MALPNLMIRAGIKVEPATGGLPSVYNIEPPGNTGFTLTDINGYLDRPGLANVGNTGAAGTLLNGFFRSQDTNDTTNYTVVGCFLLRAGIPFIPQTLDVLIEGPSGPPPIDCFSSCDIANVENNTGRSISSLTTAVNPSTGSNSTVSGNIRRWSRPISSGATESSPGQSPFTTDGSPNGTLTARVNLTFSHL